MKQLFVLLVLIFFNKSLSAADFFVFDKQISIPKNCIHYIVPNRYMCREPYAQVETAKLSFVQEFFKRKDIDKSVPQPTSIDDYHHFFLKSLSKQVDVFYYAVCQNDDCILVVTDNLQAIDLWLGSLSQPLIYSERP